MVNPEIPKDRIGVIGSGEGGFIALCAAALDTRIQAALVSGYFDSRQRVWQEPIYRNLFGLLREFGDAEVATLIAPRTLIIEHSPVPGVDGPPKPSEGAPDRFRARRTTLERATCPLSYRCACPPSGGGTRDSPLRGPLLYFPEPAALTGGPKGRSSIW